jgi:hypothetical protein
MMRPAWLLLVGCTTVELVACAPENAPQTPPEDELVVRVETENWDATRLCAYCDGTELTVIRDLAIGRASTSTVRRGACQTVVVAAEGISGDVCQSNPIQVPYTLLVHLMADLPQSWFTIQGAM